MKIKPNQFINMQGTSEIMRSNNKKYTVRQNRMRFFYPDEFTAFYDKLSNKQKITFNFLINTGARINEVRNIRVGDIDFDRNSIIIRWTKARNPDGSRRMRTLPVSSQFSKWARGIIKEYNLQTNDLFPIISTPAANVCMKKTLKEIGVADWIMFSVHNVRKTLETWLIALDVDSMKITKHFGHSVQVASKYYISPDAFNFEDKKLMREIIGDLYYQTRGF